MQKRPPSPPIKLEQKIKKIKKGKNHYRKIDMSRGSPILECS
jgi:hypothetical protein